MVLRVAWRGVLRNRRRSFVTVGAMGFAGFIMVFYAALLDGYMLQMKRNALSMEIGELQIHAPKYRRDPDLYKLIESPDRIIDALEGRGYRATPRLYGFLLAAAGSSSSGVQVRGIDVERERGVTNIHKHLKKGKWISDEQPNGVVIGRKLARTLGVDLGDEVVVVGQAADGSMANDLFKVRGILKAVTDGIDRSGFFITQQTARALLVLPQGAHQIAVVGVNPIADLDAAVADLEDVAKGQDSASWRQLQPVLARMLDLSGASVMFMLLITYAAVAMVVLNAALMSVFERMREFGIMKAVGVSPWQVGAIVLVEACIQAIVACAIAVATGVPLALYYEDKGIDLAGIAGEASFAGVAMEPVWYTAVSVSSVVTPVIVLLLMALLAVIYPGIKAAVIRPVQAIYHR